MVAFAEIFLSRATKEFLHGRSADTLAHITLGAWRFLQDSQPDRVDVEVFNPEVDQEGWYAPVTGPEDQYFRATLHRGFPS